MLSLVAWTANPMMGFRIPRGTQFPVLRRREKPTQVIYCEMFLENTPFHGVFNSHHASPPVLDQPADKNGIRSGDTLDGDTITGMGRVF
jgi:hypothetical protein